MLLSTSRQYRFSAVTNYSHLQLAGPIMTFDQMRKSYQLSGLLEHEVHADPIEQFHRWFHEAKTEDVPSWLELNAMTLATADASGRVTSRIVLLKGIEAGRFCFFTNYRSAKARQMDENSSVSLCFLWPHLERQIRINGTVAKTSRETSVAYFQSRPRGSQLGAHLSQQSSSIPNRTVLEQELKRFEAEYEGREVPCPEFWGGYAVTPNELEFWQGRENRLHDRIVYHKADDQWIVSRLAP
jgi:pyridoxamine 5'-phosphate oxidase